MIVPGAGHLDAAGRRRRSTMRRPDAVAAAGGALRRRVRALAERARRALERGGRARVVSGLGMLLHQARAAGADLRRPATRTALPDESDDVLAAMRAAVGLVARSWET